MRFLEICFFGRNLRHIVNPRSTLILVPLISVPQVLGILFWDNFDLTLYIALGIAILFVATYSLGVILAKKMDVSQIHKII